MIVHGLNEFNQLRQETHSYAHSTSFTDQATHALRHSSYRRVIRHSSYNHTTRKMSKSDTFRKLLSLKVSKSKKISTSEVLYMNLNGRMMWECWSYLCVLCAWLHCLCRQWYL